MAILQVLSVPGCLCMCMHKCKTALLIQPSSAAAERVFPLLKNIIKDNQARALEDYIETSIMLQYNRV